MSARYVVESYLESDRRWLAENCGVTTLWETREEAETMRRQIVALGEGWTEENTRVRDTRIAMYEREAPHRDD